MRRPAGEHSESVLATKAELDGWIAARPIRPTFLLPRSAADHHERLKEFHHRAEELHRLSERNEQLRDDVAKSLSVLQANVQALLEQQIPPCSSARRLLADILPFDPQRKKAN